MDSPNAFWYTLVSLKLTAPISHQKNSTIPSSLTNNDKIQRPTKLRITTHCLSNTSLQVANCLLARINNWGNLQLLSGISTVYFQGAYSGESMLDAESVKDTLEIALGRDENILLERKLDKELSTEQTFGSKVKKELHWEIAVRSNKSHPIMLELIDQVPLSDNKNVSIEVVDLAKAKHETKTGKLTWELRLEPNSSKKVAFSYELKYPESALVYN